MVGGLDNPRGIAVDKYGRVFVAEAGRGGDTLVDTPLGDSEGPVCVGDTGAITRIKWRQAKRVITSLPSVTEAVDGACGGPGFGFAATGPHDVAIRGQRLTYSLGLGGTPAIRDLLAAGDPTAIDFGTLQGAWGRAPGSVDLAAFEEAANPDHDAVDSNPYGVLSIKRRGTVATDAGGNSLLHIAADGTTGVLAAFAPRCVPWDLGPNPIPSDQNPCGDDALFPAQAVPTDVAKARDGSYLVTTLGGFPFAVGESIVYKVDPNLDDGPAICSTFPPVPASGCEVFADGLTALVGIDVARNGTVYVVQMADAGLLAAFSGAPGTDAGSVKVLDRHTGDVVRSIDGLSLPGGVAVRGGQAFITNHSIVPGAGEVVIASIR